MFSAGPLFSLLVWSILVSSSSSYVNWIYPASANTGLTFNYIDTVFFTWESGIADPWMNLWCAPNQTSPQSVLQAYHAQVSTNGTNPQSFPYSEYAKTGSCHMQVENFAGDDYANTPTFSITSNNAVQPQTWGLKALASLDKGSSSTAQASSTLAASSTILATTALTSASSPSASSSSPASKSSSPPPPSASPSIPLSLPSPRPPPPPLSPAAKAGISIGSIFCALALITILSLARIARSRRTQGKNPEPNASAPRSEHMYEERPEMGDGAWHEVHGAARPSELQGVPQAELDAGLGR